MSHVRPRADVTAAVWLQVGKATGRQVEVGKDPFLQRDTCFSPILESLIHCSTRLVFFFDRLDGLPLKSKVSVRVLDRGDFRAFLCGAVHK